MCEGRKSLVDDEAGAFEKNGASKRQPPRESSSDLSAPFVCSAHETADVHHYATKKQSSMKCVVENSNYETLQFNAPFTRIVHMLVGLLSD